MYLQHHDVRIGGLEDHQGGGGGTQRCELEDGQRYDGADRTPGGVTQVVHLRFVEMCAGTQTPMGRAYFALKGDRQDGKTSGFRNVQGSPTGRPADGRPEDKNE